MGMLKMNQDEYKDIPTIYVGYDPREDEPYEILKYSALKQASGPINVYPIKQDLMRRTGLYRRAWQLGNSKFPSLKNESVLQHRDESDGRPFATDFAFSRFLTPVLILVNLNRLLINNIPLVQKINYRQTIQY